MPTALKLTVHQGDDVIAQETFERDVVKIGRLASAHLKLDDPKVSRIHAVIEATHDGVGYAIIDMGSTEGTMLNGRKISKERLSDGDELRLGDLRVMVNMALDAASLTPGPETEGDGLEPPSPPLIDLSSKGSGGSPPPPPVDGVDGADDPGTGLVSDGEGEPAPADDGPPTDDPAGESTVHLSSQDVEATEAAVDEPSPSGSTAPVEGKTTMMPVPDVASGARAVARSAPPAESAPEHPSTVGRSSAPVQGPVSAAPVFFDPWGTVPNNLASESVPAPERVLEIRTVWGTNVLDTFTIDDAPTVTIGDDRRVVGWGPFERIETCDIQVPSQGLPSKSFALAEKESAPGTHYRLSLPPGFDGYIQRADGTIIPLAHLYQGAEGAYPGELPGVMQYRLRPAETVFLIYGNVVFQVRYIRQNRLLAPPLWSEINYAWLNILLLAMFVHVMAIVSFLSAPNTTAELTEDIFRHPVRFAQFRLTPEQRRKRESSLLSRLKDTREAGRAKGKEGKAGQKDAKTKKPGRMAAKAVDPNKDKAAAQNALDRLLGNTPGKGARGIMMGTGRLGGELQAALGGVSGRDVGAAAGLRGLGARGVGPGGGGQSMDSVSLGSLGTRGRGGGLGGSGYGEGAARLGSKKERDIEISAGNAIIQGSLDKDLIRKVIKDHIAQIRYCYERELQASPGLAGKVATRWIINAQGRVERPKVDQTSLRNAKVERCVLSKIRTWRFPKPKGGGIVIVKYPFIFKTSG